MKAIVRKGREKGRLVMVVQWCNDWFMIDIDTGITKIVSPSSLLFTHEDYLTITKHKNNGMLFSWYESVVDSRNKYDLYFITFKKIRDS